MLNLTDTQRDEICAAAWASYQHNAEACGIIDVAGEIVSLPNKARLVGLDEANNFAIDYSSFPKDITAIWHSHNNGSNIFSPLDVKLAKKTGKPIVLFDVQNNRWRTANDRWGDPYCGRDYTQGLHDCLTLIIEWYDREMGLKPSRDRAIIEAKDSVYEWVWHNPTWNLFATGLEEEGFARIHPHTKVEYGDFLLFSIGGGNGNHCGVIVDDGKNFLHQLYNKESSIASLDSAWSQYLIGRYRHRSKL